MMWWWMVGLGCQPRPSGADLTLIVQRASNQDLEAVVPEDVQISWSVDGEPREFGLRVPARELTAGQNWTLSAVGADGRTQTDSFTVPAPIGGNVLVLLLDDVGVDKLAAFGGSHLAPTPRLDSLAEQGVRFRRAYASPVCSPTRASLLTGRQPSRTGLGWIVDTLDRDYALAPEEVTIPEALRASGAGYDTSAVGKWHLAGPNAAGWLDHPNDQGFNYFAGSPGNPSYQPDGGYYNWSRNENGVVAPSTVYMTTATVDDALARIEVMPEPWFLYVAFNAAHGPLSLPPQPLLSGEVPRDGAPGLERYDAVLEALDTEIGRLVDGMPEDVRARTHMFTLGDNGTARAGIPPAVYDDRHKHSPHELGIRVPLIVNSPLVSNPGASSDALVHVVDILPTVAELAGVPIENGQELVFEGQTVPLDGHSWVPILRQPGLPGQRTTVVTEAFTPNGPPPYSGQQETIQNATHKLIVRNNARSFFRLQGPLHLDRVDLLKEPLEEEDRAHYVRLLAALQARRDRVAEEP